MTHSTRVTHRNLVHYITPFHPSGWLPRLEALAVMEKDERRWLRLEELEMVSDAQRAVGPPHIEAPAPEVPSAAADPHRDGVVTWCRCRREVVVASRRRRAAGSIGRVRRTPV